MRVGLTKLAWLASNAPANPAKAPRFPWLVVLATAAVVALLWAGTFEQVRDYLQFTLELSTFVAVAGVFWLRWKEPLLPRPFRAWGYPVTPALFLFFTGYVLVRVAMAKPLESSLGAATVALGGIVFALTHRSATQEKSR